MQFSRLFALGLIMGLALTLSACGGKEEKNGGAKKASEKIVGKWDMDPTATLAKIEAEAKTDEEKAALEFTKAMISAAKMSFEFTADGKMVWTMSAGDMNKTEEGTYKVKSEDASSVVVSGTMDNETTDVTIKLLDDNTLELTMPEGGGPETVVLKRAN